MASECRECERWRQHVLSLYKLPGYAASLDRIVCLNFSTPAITSLGDDGLVSLAWNRSEDFFELEVTPAGFSWFYRDRRNWTVEGGDEPVPVLPPRAAELLGALGHRCP